MYMYNVGCPDAYSGYALPSLAPLTGAGAPPAGRGRFSSRRVPGRSLLHVARPELWVSGFLEKVAGQIMGF